MPELRHTQSNPYPRGQGTSAVPVLFALQNVQPSIVSAAAVPEAVTSNDANAAAAKSSLASGPIASTATESTKSVPKPVGGKSNTNRLYNATIFGLIAILFVLAVRNSSGKSKPSESSTASNTATTPLEPARGSLALNDVPPAPPSIATQPASSNANTESAPILSVPALSVPKLASNAPLVINPSDMSSPVPSATATDVSSESSSSASPSAPTGPAVPLLLTPANPSSSAPALTSPSFANEPSSVPSRPYGSDSYAADSSNQNNASGFGSSRTDRETVVERPAVDNPTASDRNVSNDPNNRQSTNPLVVDSNNPELDVHSLYSILLKTRNGNQAGSTMPNLAVAPANNPPRYSNVSSPAPQYTPYTPMSSGIPTPTGAPQGADGMMLSGQTYPAQQKDLRPIPITAAPYENNAQSQSRSMNVIMQPNSSNPNVQWNSNRYQGGTITVPAAVDANGNALQQPVYQPVGAQGNRALESEMPPIRPYAPIGTNIVPPANAGNQNVIYPQQPSR